MNVMKRSKRRFNVFTTTSMLLLISIYPFFLMSTIYSEFDPYIDHGGTVLGIIWWMNEWMNDNLCTTVNHMDDVSMMSSYGW